MAPVLTLDKTNILWVRRGTLTGPPPVSTGAVTVNRGTQGSDEVDRVDETDRIEG